MRIAVDARPLAHPDTGIGRYTESLLRRLVHSGHQWFLYSDRGISPRFEIDDHVQLRAGGVRPGSPLSLFYTQLVFPRWARGDCVDLFWSPRHHLPMRMHRSIRAVVTVHDLVWKRYPETMRGSNRWLERLLMGPSLRRAQALIAVSEFTAAEVAACFPQLDAECHVVAEAAEPAAVGYELSPQAHGRPYLLFVGTPEPRKNLQRLLQAYAAAIRDGAIDHDLLLVGAGGWGGFDLDREITRLGLDGKVLRKGRVGEVELHALYAGSTALLMPSLYEGFGLPALEAMGHGIPVLAGSGSAMPEVVGEGGLLVDPASVEQIHAGLLALCGDSELRERLGRQARQQAATFSWDRAAAETLHILEATADVPVPTAA